MYPSSHLDLDWPFAEQECLSHVWNGTRRYSFTQSVTTFVFFILRLARNFNNKVLLLILIINLNGNKLAINLTKTVQMNLKASASNYAFSLNQSVIKSQPVCKYLGIYIDNNLSFKSQVDYVTKRLGKQCGIISKLRHYAPRFQLINYYRSNVSPIIQYGILVYRCCSYSRLNPIFSLQKKILKFVHFRNRRDHCNDIFFSKEILTVYELHLY